MDVAFASTVLSRPARALIFAVVARALGCMHTEAEGMDDAEIDTALATLQSKRLAQNESALLSWARDTVSYLTPAIQKQTRQLAAQIGNTAVLEAIGTAALANAIVRLAMLLE